jgi:hypothetical protein
VIIAKVTVFGGGRFADAAIVADEGTSAVFHGAPRKSCQPSAVRQLTGTVFQL